MKNQLFLAGYLLASFYSATAQTWAGSTSPTGIAYRTDPVGIGTNAPAYQLDVSTNIADNGMRLTQTNNGATRLILQNNTSGGRIWSVNSSGSGNSVGTGHFCIYDDLAAQAFNPRLMISSGIGNIGVNKINPATRLDMFSNTNGADGITFTQNGTGDCALYLTNANSIGKSWRLNSDNAGHFTIKDNSSGVSRFEIMPNGRIAIGPVGAAIAKVHIASITDQFGITCNISNGSPICIAGNADSPSNTGGNTPIGVFGEAMSGQFNYGGYFSGVGDPLCTPGVVSYGMYARVTQFGGPLCPDDRAGLFDGDVEINGDVYGSQFNWTSDQKLKKDIKALTNGMDKIMQLKPSTYIFRTDEFKGMNLPENLQLGLIAQELEKVLPELVTEIAGRNQIEKGGKILNTLPSHKVVNYIGLIPVLISGMQEQQATIESQQKTIAQQSAINTDLQKQLDEQKQLISSLSQKVSGANGISSNGSVETGFQMSQNEPNPFTHETVVNYILPQNVSSAFMAVYDLTGKQVASFPIVQKGSSSLTITSEKLAAGIYIYSVVADGKVMDSKRMIVAEK